MVYIKYYRQIKWRRILRFTLLEILTGVTLVFAGFFSAINF
jgi:hypothetical protein